MSARPFEVVRDGEVIADGAEFDTAHGARPVVVVDRGAPMPVVYGAASHVGMAYERASVRYLDEPTAPAAAPAASPRVHAARVESGDGS